MLYFADEWGIPISHTKKYLFQHNSGTMAPSSAYNHSLPTGLHHVIFTNPGKSKTPDEGPHRERLQILWAKKSYNLSVSASWDEGPNIFLLHRLEVGGWNITCLFWSFSNKTCHTQAELEVACPLKCSLLNSGRGFTAVRMSYTLLHICSALYFTKSLEA